jgi:NADH:ubiquinone oxidoreductase subunit F (NADH-binding)
LSVSGDCARPGLYEYPFGVRVEQVLKDCGAIDVAAVQVSGPSGMLRDRLEMRGVFHSVSPPSAVRGVASLRRARLRFKPRQRRKTG